MTAEVKNAPLLAGWAIAAGVGAVAFGVAFVVGQLGANASVAAGAVLFVIVGVILGLPWGGDARAAVVAAPQEKPVAPPVETFAAAPAAFVAMPAAVRRPEALAAPRGGTADELQLIEGIGPKLEQLCHSLGFFHFDQIANWTADEIAWVDENLAGFKGRVTRDKWVAQARLILDVGRDEFLRRAKTNDY
jgi:predicted flap endonuclease-1-like 5' DNA nuclease